MRNVTTIVGATGMLGGAVCELLTAAGVPTRALVRPTSEPGRLERLRRAGVELRRGDLKDRASLEAACEGARAVISTATSVASRQPGDSLQTVDLDGQLALVDAARRAGVEHFVYISFAPLPIDFPLQEAKRAVEKALMVSGIPHYTILRPTHFAEVWLSPALGFDYVNDKAQLLGAGRGKMHWISVQDVARFAVSALTHPRAWNTVLELGSEEALSQLDVVRLFEQRSGRTWKLEPIPEQELRARFEAATDPIQRSFAGLMLNTVFGSPVDPGPAMDILELRPSRLSDYVERVLAARPAELQAPQPS